MNNRFSENLKKIRKDNNLSQEQLADEIGVSRQAISKWESSVAYPEMDKIITLCEKFNLNIDDLLHKDIREIKKEEEGKKTLNKYFEDFLHFITETIDMFTKMKFKTKCKCIFEQVIMATILFLIWLFIGFLTQELLSGIFSIIPYRLYYILHSILHFIYGILAIISSVVIILHIFKTRYLDYYETYKKDNFSENKQDIELEKNEKEIKKDNKLDLKNNNNKIIIRDPNHSEFRFLNGLWKCIVVFIKFFTLCFSIALFCTLISFVSLSVAAFLVYETGLFFWGLFITMISLSIINIIIVLLLLNFLCNRKNEKKKLIWSFILSLIMLGIGTGIIIFSSINFKYTKNDSSFLKTDILEFEMKDDLFFEHYTNSEVEYIETNDKNVKVEYIINKFCEIQHNEINSSGIDIISSCENPLNIIKEAINAFNKKKIINITDDIISIKIYSSKENIDKLKKNHDKFINIEIQNQNIINDYEKRINELSNKLSTYISKENNYIEEINNLKEQLKVYQEKN